MARVSIATGTCLSVHSSSVRVMTRICAVPSLPRPANEAMNGANAQISTDPVSQMRSWSVRAVASSARVG